MKNSKIAWNKYPQDEPKKDGFYLVTISHYEDYVIVCDYSATEKWSDSGVIAWAELPVPFGRSGRTETQVDWHPYPDKKPDVWGIYLATASIYEERDISVILWLPSENKFFGEDEYHILAWAEMPEPYKERL